MQNEEKRKRIIASFTVAGVILVVVLFAIVVYQLIEISVLSQRRTQLRQEYDSILSQIDDANDWLENYELNEDAIMYQLALQNGYRPR